jgi:hypothetical protein
LGGVIAGTKVKLALPAAVICADPIRLMSEHTVAVLLQKLTVPLVTGVAPASTVAVNVTCAGAVTDPPEVIVTPPLVMASVVVVAAPAAKAGEHTRDIATMVTAVATPRILVCLRGETWQPRTPDRVWTGLFERMVKISGETRQKSRNAIGCNGKSRHDLTSSRNEDFWWLPTW